MANKFSSARRLLKRPKVCKPPPPPPPPPPECSIDPDEIECQELQPVDISVDANKLSLPVDDPVDVNIIGEACISGFKNILNRAGGEDMEVNCDCPPGIYFVQVCFTFSDSSICCRDLKVTVIENGGD